jgi:O-antigen/teichoic acid export membrane protein
MLIAFIISVVLYFVLIPPFQAVGAAIASASGVVVFNALKYYHLKKNFQLELIHKNAIVICLIGFAVLVSIYCLPNSKYWLVNSIWKTSLASIIYCFILFKAKLLPHVNEYILKMMKR